MNYVNYINQDFHKNKDLNDNHDCDRNKNRIFGHKLVTIEIKKVHRHLDINEFT